VLPFRIIISNKSRYSKTIISLKLDILFFSFINSDMLPSITTQPFMVEISIHQTELALHSVIYLRS